MDPMTSGALFAGETLKSISPSSSSGPAVSGSGGGNSINVNIAPKKKDDELLIYGMWIVGGLLALKIWRKGSL